MKEVLNLYNWFVLKHNILGKFIIWAMKKCRQNNIFKYLHYTNVSNRQLHYHHHHQLSQQLSQKKRCWEDFVEWRKVSWMGIVWGETSRFLLRRDNIWKFIMQKIIKVKSDNFFNGTNSLILTTDNIWKFSMRKIILAAIFESINGMELNGKSYKSSQVLWMGI